MEVTLTRVQLREHEVECKMAVENCIQNVRRSKIAAVLTMPWADVRESKQRGTV